MNYQQKANETVKFIRLWPTPTTCPQKNSSKWKVSDMILYQQSAVYSTSDIHNVHMGMITNKFYDM